MVEWPGQASNLEEIRNPNSQQYKGNMYSIVYNTIILKSTR